MRASASSYGPRWRRRTPAKQSAHLDVAVERSMRRKAKRQAREQDRATTQLDAFPAIRATVDGPAVVFRHPARHVHRFWPGTDGNGKVIDRCCCGAIA